MNIKIGSKVELKSGGCKMIVSGPPSSPTGVAVVPCMWHDVHGVPHRETYPAEALLVSVRQ